MHSSFKNRAYKLVGGDFQTPESVRTMVKKIHKRRGEVINPKLFSSLRIEDLVGKTPFDFKDCFTVGSTGYHADDQCLENLYDNLLDDIGMYDMDKFDEEKAREFKFKVYRAMRHSRVHLGAVIDRLKEGQLVFPEEHKNETRRLVRAMKKRLNEPKYKFETETISKCVVHGVRSGLDFVVVCGEPEIMEVRKLKKIIGVLKKVYGRDSGDLVKPIKDVW
jgi:hypothetical protein